MAYGTINADLMTTSDGVSSSGLYGFKNRIINGAAVIAQRGTSFSGLSDDGGQYTLDRWRWSENGTYTGSQTVTQDSSAPTGFNYSLKVVTNTAITTGTSLSSRVEQFIEGFNWADMAYGTANAKTATLSFWVRSSLTGTFGGAFRNSADDRSYPFSYTISVADTWEQKSITIAGDTSGTWIGATNGTGLRVTFSLGAGTALSGTANTWASAGYQSVTGAVSVVGTLNATWFVTGVQLEKGSTATSFDYRPYGTELNLCLRYFYKVVGTSSYPTFGAGGAISTTEGRIAVQYPVQMRATPTLSYGGTVLLTASNGNGITVTSIASNYGNETGGMLAVGVASGLSAGNGTLFITQNGSSSNFIQATAEL
jgi:hypothetical protein